MILSLSQFTTQASCTYYHCDHKDIANHRLCVGYYIVDASQHMLCLLAVAFLNKYMKKLSCTVKLFGFLVTYDIASFNRNSLTMQRFLNLHPTCRELTLLFLSFNSCWIHVMLYSERKASWCNGGKKSYKTNMNIYITFPQLKIELCCEEHV